MFHPLIVLALPVVLCTPGAGPAVEISAHRTAALAESGPTADSLEEVYRRGQRWDAFFDGVNRRQELWMENRTNASVPGDLALRARRVGGWRILVITEPGCSDSANSIPYIAKLVETTPGLEMRLIDSTVGRAWMEAHRTPDGRAATPTVLVLDENYRIRGCWIEQPAALQAIWLPIVARGTMARDVGEKMAWYARDAGRETLREFVAVLEGAQRGEPICPGA